MPRWTDALRRPCALGCPGPNSLRRGAARRLVWAVSALLWFLPLGHAQAGRVGSPRFESLVQSADAIVIATVGAYAYVVPEPDSIIGPVAFTDFNLSIEDVWKGPLSKRDHATFRRFGGPLPSGRWIVGSGETPILLTGHRLVLILSRGPEGVWRDSWRASQEGVYEIEGGKVSGLFARGTPVGQFRSLVRDANRSAMPPAGARTGQLFVRLHDADHADRPVRSLVRIQQSRAVFSIFDAGRSEELIRLPAGHQALEFYPVGGEPKTVVATVIAGRTDTVTVSLRAWLK